MSEKKERRTSNSPSLKELESELDRERSRIRSASRMRNAFYILMTVAAAAVLAAMLVIPVLRINGTSMTNTLQDRDIVVALNKSGFKPGSVIAFYYNNSILVKRVIAKEGDWVDIDEEGNVFVNGQQLDEPYVSEKAKGSCNIQLPYQVPQNKLFIMGDHRETSIDSRNTAIGCIDKSLVIGKVFVRVLPIQKFGPIR